MGPRFCPTSAPLCLSALYCNRAQAVLKRPKTSDLICRTCFLQRFEDEIHHTITSQHLFNPGERVAIAASGGKDSTVLAYILTKLNREQQYGLDLFLLSVDEGISGYRDDSLRSVERNQQEYGLALTIVSYKQLYGWTMDEIVGAIGQSNNCTFCGVFRRQALDRGAVYLNADKIATGHNADDIAETVLMNILRGDVSRLDRSTDILTGGGGMESPLPRCKPFKYAYEKEIVMYAYYRQLDYFTTECVYAPFAYRGYAREFLKQCERAASASIVDIVRSGEEMEVREDVKQSRRRRKAASLHAANPAEAATADGDCDVRLCQRCGYISSNPLCKACVLLEGLNKSRAKREVEEERKADTECEERKEVVADKSASSERKEWANEVDVMSGADRERVSAVFGRVRNKNREQRERGRVEPVSSSTDDRKDGGTAHDRPAHTASTAMSIAEKLQGTSW